MANRITYGPIFLPPGIQMRFGEHVPRHLPIRYVKRIEELWRRRNTAPESDLYGIDNAVFGAAQQGQQHALAMTPPRLAEGHHLHGTGDRRHTLFWMLCGPHSRNLWDNW